MVTPLPLGTQNVTYHPLDELPCWAQRRPSLFKLWEAAETVTHAHNLLALCFHINKNSNQNHHHPQSTSFFFSPSSSDGHVHLRI